ncbi:threonine-phosphate decarboxylase CobD [Halalkalibacter alkalisediminis]|uniref:threonine-phosphate decarboxylase n=1 Tax=Halalkalibacter alkalisediminis TaxID=935616 RepID=A0ABV6NGN5_9BACI|nr:threonine-phosphate decarboxylase CobD [Halalkalibacter alkalisediminis]
MFLPNHGANPKQLIEALGKQIPNDLIDFSENTNPYGPPSAVIQFLNTDFTKTMTNYPDPHVTELTSKLAQFTMIPTKNILVGNGAAELIFLLANFFQGKRVAIVEPAFSEYRDACEAFECNVTSIVLSSPWHLDVNMVLSSISDIDVLFLCSPNNPTGVSYHKEEIIHLIEAAEKQGVYVVLDEAFYDFTEADCGLHQLVNRFSTLVIIRSLTKMFAIAGIRLGYLLANSDLITKLRIRQPTWSVNGIAQQVGLSLLKEDAFVEQTLLNIHQERRRVTSVLNDLDFFVSDSVVNFYLLAERDRKDLMPLLVFLLEKGIIARHTYNFNGLDGRYLRLAVKTRENNDQLMDALAMWRKR